ncbi:MAG TPA: hypothetical protein VLI71_09835 [Gammaproteobacteria bacterium]|nr:hypothetical protein [Gammaproteobacteria bacterium]
MTDTHYAPSGLPALCGRTGETTSDLEEATCTACLLGNAVRFGPEKRRPLVTPEAEEQARPLVGVYFQTSRKHRLVARFPKGVDPMSALTAAARGSRPWDVENWVEMLGPRNAGDYYLRCYAPPEDQLELGRDVFEAFLKLGGTTYDGRLTPRSPMPAGWLRECAELLERERMRDSIVSSCFDAARAFGWDERSTFVKLVQKLVAEREHLINLQLERMTLSPVPLTVAPPKENP